MAAKIADTLLIVPDLDSIRCRLLAGLPFGSLIAAPFRLAVPEYPASRNARSSHDSPELT